LRCRLLLRRVLFICSLLRLACSTLTFSGTLFGLGHILTQLAITAEQATVVYYELGLFAFLVCHITPD
jgi:hypothetical protein